MAPPPPALTAEPAATTAAKAWREDEAKPLPQPLPPVQEPAVAAPPELEQLRSEAGRLGIAIDGRWGTARLQYEIAKVRK